MMNNKKTNSAKQASNSNTNTLKETMNMNTVKVNPDGTVTMTVEQLRELLLGAPKQAQTAPKAAPKAPAVSKAKAAKPATKAEPKKTGADALKAYRESVKGKPYTVTKFGTQETLRIGGREVAHVNTKTKRGNCVAVIHAKATDADMVSIKEFFVKYADEFSYSAPMFKKARITCATDIKRMSLDTMKAAFGC